MAVVVTTAEDRTLLRSSRTGLGLLNAMFSEIYCAELANRTEWLHKVSITITAFLSTAAAVSLIQVTAPRAAPYFAVASAVVSTMGSMFAWRSRTLVLVKASRAYGDLVIEWTEAWESLRTTKTENSARLGILERRSNEIGESIAPIRVKTWLGRKLQKRIRIKVGLI
jgi:hypothetical protein